MSKARMPCGIRALVCYCPIASLDKLLFSLFLTQNSFKLLDIENLFFFRYGLFCPGQSIFLFVDHIGEGHGKRDHNDLHP